MYSVSEFDIEDNYIGCCFYENKEESIRRAISIFQRCKCKVDVCRVERGDDGFLKEIDVWTINKLIDDDDE